MTRDRGAPDATANLPTFLAFSLEMERESAERLREGAAIMAAHRQHSAARMLEQLAVYSDRHAEDVAAICDGHDLPQFHPWDFEWPDGEAPETCDYDALRYEMSDHEVLVAMHALEQRAAAYYRSVAERSPDPKVVKYANEFADEELEHASSLQEWMALHPEVQSAPDIDPPREID